MHFGQKKGTCERAVLRVSKTSEWPLKCPRNQDNQANENESFLSLYVQVFKGDWLNRRVRCHQLVSIVQSGHLAVQSEPNAQLRQFSFDQWIRKKTSQQAKEITERPWTNLQKLGSVLCYGR